ncbi:unnamed protein product [Acanthoscelides obtectus]|uniref:Tc1-like transposase DDE domain-containing protein n=1 Tax=Acanthoscelides obtectus TaxID=200917 RepID=A0A9P0Q6U1_ACAOB|nr:unnamed protein product [Acanthoscelides obtectus]CAK1643040.1 Histone-lysine N-methyltransferase SETMAR [Acanthoscelides obtectus]
MWNVVDTAPHQSTISRWYGEFKRGRVSLNDDPRSSRKTSMLYAKLIIEDRHVTYREIEASLKISETSIQKILHDELGVRKLVSQNVYSIVSGDESWIYCYGSENKQQSAVWVFQGEEKPTKMVATFASKARHIATIPLNEHRTILYQNNASSHTAQKTRQYLTEENVELLDHPPYSPDLSPNDFFTFSKVKNGLRGQRFQSPEEPVDAFKNAVLGLPANEWNKCFENWFEHMQIWAKEHRQWTPQQRCAIEWSDEARFEVSVGSMSSKGIGKLHFIDGNVDTNKYLAILEESLLPVMEECLTSGQDFVFQQDGAAYHTSKKAIKCMEENNVPLLKWISSSPDLSPIETLWHGMKKNFSRNEK